MLKIAVTGAKGRLGSELVRRGCVPVEADITYPFALAGALEAIKPDVVINCAAKTDVDACEGKDMVAAARVNAQGVKILSDVFARKIVQISTDFVFDGRHGPYDEDAQPCPINLYGWSKLGGELALINSRNEPGYLIVRTTWLFDAASSNPATVFARELARGNTIFASPFMLTTPTYVPHLAAGILAAVEQGVSGILNLAGSRLVSRFEFAYWVANAMGACANQVQPGGPYGVTPRPEKAGLRVGKARALGLPIGDPLEGIQEVIHALETMETR